jgi:hypothetical protein
MTYRQKAEFLAKAGPSAEPSKTATQTGKPNVGAHVCAILSPRIPHLFPCDPAAPLSPRLAELMKQLKRLDTAR